MWHSRLCRFFRYRLCYSLVSAFAFTYSQLGPSFLNLFVQYSQIDLPPLRPLCGEAPPGRDSNPGRAELVAAGTLTTGPPQLMVKLYYFKLVQYLVGNVQNLPMWDMVHFKNLAAVYCTPHICHIASRCQSTLKRQSTGFKHAGLGTRDNSGDHLTLFKGQTIVASHITAKYCAETPF